MRQDRTHARLRDSSSRIDKSLTKGLSRTSDFLDEGELSELIYPEVGKIVGAVVVGYSESNRREIYLNAKPCILHKALVPLKTPAFAS